MKNISKTTIFIFLAIIIAGTIIGALIFNKDPNNKSQENQSVQNVKQDNITADQTETGLENDENVIAKSKPENYISLTEYESNEENFKEQRKVYFFHASWCPICKSIDEDINSDNSQIPSDVTFIKTDFDASTDLRKKYGVTTQYSFVQIDNDGNEIAQWSATNLDKAIAGIK